MNTFIFTSGDPDNREHKATIRKRLTLKASTIIKATFFCSFPVDKKMFKVYYKRFYT